MAWTKQIDLARDHLAVIAEEVAIELDRRVKLDPESVTDEHRDYRQAIQEEIYRLSHLLGHSTRMELEIRVFDDAARPARRAYRKKAS